MFSEADPLDLAGLNANINTGITNFGLARDGKVDKNGLPGILQQAVWDQKHSWCSPPLECRLELRKS